jgi:glycopeptide antibiotics resistance protein
MVVLSGWYLLVIATVVFVAWRALCWRRHGVRRWHETAVVVLFVWSLAVAYVALFPMHIIFYDWHGRFSLVPLSSSIDMIRYSTASTVVKNLGGNVLLFVPIGFLLPVLFERLRRVWSLAWRAAVISAVIEIVQIPTQAHSTDVDDVIFNIVGALIGFALFWAVWALVRKRELGRRLREALSSRSRREPLLIALVPFAIILVLTAGVLAPKVVAGTISREAITRGVGGPDGAEVARAETGGYLIVVCRSGTGVQEALWCSVFKKVLPGRFTAIAVSDMIRTDGSGYDMSVAPYNPSRGEKPLVFVWGRNEDGATSATLNIRGRPAGRASVGRYFVAAFSLTDGGLRPDGTLEFGDLSFAFTDSAGLDLTVRYTRW